MESPVKLFHLVLLDGFTAKYHEPTHAKIRGETWVHPALAHGHLYVHDSKELMCSLAE